MIIHSLLHQIFFDDSARNIASGKAAGLHTVIVSSKHFRCTLYWMDDV